MPPKSQAGGRRKRRTRPQKGGSKFTDFFTKTIPRAATTVYEKGLKPAHNWVKDKKLVSNILGVIPDTRFKVAAIGARALGYGKVGNYIKDKKLVSTMLGSVADHRFKAASNAARAIGLGKTRGARSHHVPGTHVIRT